MLRYTRYGAWNGTPYSGDALTNGSFSATDLEPGDDHSFVVAMTAASTITNFGIKANEIATVDGIAVTTGVETEVGNYLVTAVNGTLKVTEKALTITADSASKAYDGTALTKSSYTNTALAAGDHIESVMVTGSQTAVGSSANVPNGAVIKNGRGENVTACYDITYKNGTLTITKAPLTITAKDRAYVYNGLPQGPEGTYTAALDTYVTVTGLQGSDRLTGITLTGTAQDPGVYPIRIKPTAAQVDETADNYEIEYVPGRLTIRKTTDPSPGTGDSTKTLLWMSVMLLSAAGLGGTAWLSRRKKRRVSR